MDGSEKHSPIEVAAKGEGRIKGSQSWLTINVSASVWDVFIFLVRRDVW